MSLLGGLGPTIIVVMWVETLLAFLFIAARVYSRHFLSQSGGWDDVLTVLTGFLLMMYSVFCTAAAYHGFGQHSAILTVDQFSHANKLEIVGQTFLVVAIATSKASIAWFQLRIVTALRHKVFLWFFIVTLAIFCALVALFDFIRCKPVAHVWNPTIDASCWVSTSDYSALSVFLSAWSALVDFAYAALPWFVVWKLHMKRKEKLLISCAMSLGVFAGACSIVRAIALNGLNARSDYSYETVSLILWSSTETLISTVAACIPTYRPLWQRLFGGSHSNDPAGYQPSRPKDGDYHLRELHKTRPYGNNIEAMTDHHDDDDHSERAILEGAIKRTDQVIVSLEMDNGDARRGGEREMAER